MVPFLTEVLLCVLSIRVISNTNKFIFVQIIYVIITIHLVVISKQLKFESNYEGVILLKISTHNLKNSAFRFNYNCFFLFISVKIYAGNIEIFEINSSEIF